MANMKLVFLGTERSGTIQSELVSFCTRDSEIYISISLPGSDCGENKFICFDRQTAIAFVKHLKREIGKMEVGK